MTCQRCCVNTFLTCPWKVGVRIKELGPNNFSSTIADSVTKTYQKTSWGIKRDQRHDNQLKKGRLKRFLKSEKTYTSAIRNKGILFQIRSVLDETVKSDDLK